MNTKLPESAARYFRLRWIAPAGLVLSFLVCVCAVLFDYNLRVGGQWSTYGGGSAREMHFLCVDVVSVAMASALVFFLLTVGVCLEALGRWRRWLRVGWLSGPFAIGIAISSFERSGFMPQYGMWDVISPYSADGWLLHRLVEAAWDWSLWLAFAAALVFLHWLALALMCTIRKARGVTKEEERSSAPPTRVTSRALLLAVTVMTGVTGAALGSMGIMVIGMTDTALVVGLCTGGLSAALVALCATLPSSRGKATAACLFGAVAAALLNTPLSFAIVSLTGDGIGEHFGESLFGLTSIAAIFGSMIAAPLGLVFGLLYLVPVWVAYRLCRSLAHEALDKVLHVVGSWSFCVGCLCLAFMLLWTRNPIHLFYYMTGAQEFFVATAIIGGAAAATVGFFRLRLRRRWLRKVSRGGLEGWILVPLHESDDLVVGLPPLIDSDAPVDAVLARKLPGSPSGAYRTGDHLVPEALVATAALG